MRGFGFPSCIYHPPSPSLSSSLPARRVLKGEHYMALSHFPLHKFASSQRSGLRCLFSFCCCLFSAIRGFGFPSCIYHPPFDLCVPRTERRTFNSTVGRLKIPAVKIGSGSWRRGLRGLLFSLFSAKGDLDSCFVYTTLYPSPRRKESIVWESSNSLFHGLGIVELEFEGAVVLFVC